uniref:C-type lectin domain-containing protein n=1 Tax=Panagrolaimus sp. ES5 TaxID=591445 RepID=A0AC34GYS6_9BILA
MFYQFFVALFLLSSFLFWGEGAPACPNGGIVWQSNCLYFNSSEVEFVIAERQCQETGGHLVSVHDAFTNAFIAEKAGQIFDRSYDFWIGGNTLIGGGSNWAWTDGSIFNYADWSSGEPDITSDKQCIIVTKDDGYWSTQDCSRTRPFVCSISTVVQPTTRPPPPTPTLPQPTVQPYRNCSFGWVYFEPTNSCYGYNNKGIMMNWTAAESYCKSQGAHLASIHSYEEQMFVNEFGLVTWKSIWLGLYSVDSGNTWQWTDGSRFDYIAWYQNQPPQIYSGQNCVLLESSTVTSGYQSNPCSYIWYPICKKPFYG